MERTIRVAVLMYALWLCPGQQCLGQGVDSLLQEYARFSKNGGDPQSSAAAVERTLAREVPAVADLQPSKYVAGPTPPAPFTPPEATAPPAAADTKPAITITVAPFHCPPCNMLKSYDWSGFDVTWVTGGNVSAYPEISWIDHRGVKRILTGAYTPKRVRWSWDRTQQEAVESTDAAQAPTPIEEVRRVLAILKPRPDETFVDYGCGDGRWLIEAARTYGCRAVGVELDATQAIRARLNVAIAGLTDRVTIIEGDATQVDVDADVGVAYLYPDVLQQLRPKLAKLDRCASYIHRVDGLAMQQDGEAWIWRKPEPTPQVVVQPRGAVWGGRVYSGPVCNSPGCRMCNAIRQQLGYR